MCGIGGCVLAGTAGPEQDRLIAMRDALAHRGPDDSGIQVVGNVGLVHTRLSIVDLSERGHQPMRHPSGELWICYNGEIYNHAELRRELDGGATFTGDSDTETLLWALQQWGPQMVSRLTGQFAFAALDLRGGRLLLCRDRFGVKPLYLAQCDDGVWFASEPAALLAAGVPAEPVDTAWGGIAAGSYLGGEATLLKGITRVAPGSWTEISLQDAKVTTGRWHIPAGDVDAVSAARLKRRSRSELTSELEGTLRSAVHGALLADTTVGTLCSGGVDSSLITALAVEAKPDLVAFGASYAADGVADEGPAARRVADALGIELELLDVTPADWRRGFVPATVHYGVPIANASAVTVAQLAEHARRGGVKVLLTGEGADELFGGYGNLHAAALSAFLPWRQRMVRSAEPMLLGDPLRVLNPLRVLRKLWRIAAHLAGARPALPTWTPRLSPDTGRDEASEITDAYAHHGGQRRLLETELLSRLDYTLCWLLNRMDKNAMQRSVETRVPFLEPEVVKLALNLPLEARVGPWSKGILRDVARRVLPWSVAHRPKIYGMDFDAGSWIEQDARSGFLAGGLLRETLRIPEAEFEPVMNAADGLLKLRLWSAEVWCRSVFAGHSVAEIERELWR
jgi:asparagine synthase (glutamine-hydrolysing)